MTNRGWNMNDGGFGECIGSVSDDCFVNCPAHLLIVNCPAHLLKLHTCFWIDAFPYDKGHWSDASKGTN